MPNSIPKVNVRSIRRDRTPQAVKAMTEIIIICAPCSDNRHEECVRHYERCDCSLCAVLDVIAEMESDAAHHDDFKNLKEGK
jgi:hypothetical protein